MLKKIEITLIVAGILSFVPYLFLIPGSSQLLIVSLGALSLLYLYFSFALLNNVALRAVFKNKALKEIPIFKTLGAILVGGALSISVIGVLFKIMQWPGANLLILAALPFMLIAGTVYFMFFKKNKEAYFKGVLIRIWGIGTVVFLLFILPNNFLIDFKYRNYPEYLKAYKEWQLNSDDEVVTEKYYEELEKLHQ